MRDLLCIFLKIFFFTLVAKYWAHKYYALRHFWAMGKCLLLKLWLGHDVYKQNLKKVFLHCKNLLTKVVINFLNSVPLRDCANKKEMPGFYPLPFMWVIKRGFMKLNFWIVKHNKTLVISIQKNLEVNLQINSQQNFINKYMTLQTMQFKVRRSNSVHISSIVSSELKLYARAGCIKIMLHQIEYHVNNISSNLGNPSIRLRQVLVKQWIANLYCDICHC